MSGFLKRPTSSKTLGSTKEIVTSVVGLAMGAAAIGAIMKFLK